MATAPNQTMIFGGSEPARAQSTGRLYTPKPNGYAAQPGTGPEGETCGTCTHCRQRTARGKHYYKCGRMLAAWNRDRSTDVLLKSPACSRFDAGTPHATTAAPAGERD